MSRRRDACYGIWRRGSCELNPLMGLGIASTHWTNTALGKASSSRFEPFSQDINGLGMLDSSIAMGDFKTDYKQAHDHLDSAILYVQRNIKREGSSRLLKIIMTPLSHLCSLCRRYHSKRRQSYPDRQELQIRHRQHQYCPRFTWS
jgi:hypothetical protein